ncbi:hypothetical protein [Nocardioides sp. zg-DK7169]|uniref:hypothetical protein n=1 Tax=Nocardioides sp. zg-DK7169 TaxID=2736600 RepID=UPI0015516AE9|nr:hypothetical protein [Nocardioides sp. zg-DK7169]NPC98935.1 hypothetical protein [Nocardioides sp. zg-DK7169]
MSGSIGPLTAADEQFTHQIVDTFATVSHTDLAWAEKVCLMAAAKDGSVQIGLGFGKYVNRNVVDGYAGVARGVEQWTVRASRSLSSAPDSVDVGPIRYEVLEPLKRVRVRLEANEEQPVAYDLVLAGTVPCVTEQREDRRDPTGSRRTADQIRYHQIGVVAEGWVEIEGVRTVVEPGEWVMTRDHSWGIRPSVGDDPRDLPTGANDLSTGSVLAVWNPIHLEHPDGHTYGFHQYLLDLSAPGFRQVRAQGGFEHADGRRELLVGIDPEIRFDPDNLRFLGGTFHLTMADGSVRDLVAEPISDTGFHLGAGFYHRPNGDRNGSWRGEYWQDGNHYADTSRREVVEEINQFRDCMIRVHDTHTGATGWGNLQTFVSGAWPALGLDEAPGLP